MDSSASVNWEEIERSLVDSILKDFNVLRQVWERIGFDNESLEDRCKQAVTHFSGLSSMMIEEDENLYERLVENVKVLRQTLQQYCTELDVPVPQLEEGPPLALKRQLASLLDGVSTTRQDRLDSLEELRYKEAGLCGCLQMELHKLQEDRPVPTARDLEELSRHVEMLVTEKEARMRKYLVIRNDILIALEVLQKTASTALEVEMMSELTNEAEIKLPREKLSAMKELSETLDLEKAERTKRLQEMIKELSFLWELLEQDKEQLQEFLLKNGHCGQRGLSAVEKELSRCRDLRKANMGRFIMNLRRELHDCWDKCKASSEQRQTFNAHLASDDFSEELLKIHEREVVYWRNMYQQFEPLFVKVDRIAAHFQKMLQLQQRMTDKNRFQNRGGQLLQEEKERKKVLLLIPKMAKELQELAAQYEETVGTPFLVGGETLDQYLQHQWDLMIQEKENDKLQRKQRKEEQLCAATPRKQQHLGASSVLFKSPGMSLRGMTLRSPSAYKSPGATLAARNTPLRRQILKSPSGNAGNSASRTPYARPTPQKWRQIPGTPTPTLSRVQPRVATVVPISYSAFEGPLNDPERSTSKRSTMNQTTVQKVLGSKRTPIFTNSGAKRKRFSNGRSPKMTSRSASRHSPRNPLATSTRAASNALKLPPVDMPFMY